MEICSAGFKRVLKEPCIVLSPTMESTPCSSGNIQADEAKQGLWHKFQSRQYVFDKNRTI